MQFSSESPGQRPMFLPSLSTLTEGALDDDDDDCDEGRLGGGLATTGVVIMFTAEAVLCAGAATN